jgi:hypothetical protein
MKTPTKDGRNSHEAKDGRMTMVKRRSNAMGKVMGIATIKGFIFTAALVLFANSALAIAPADQIDRLGKDLTPVGAEKAGNAAGTIPEWTGGITEPPAGWTEGQKRPDPFAEERPRFTINRDNVDQYKENLTEGQMELIKRYDGYEMNVYPSHRTCSFSQWVYDRSKKNAGRATLDEDDIYLTKGWGPFLFPIPNSGAEAIWNHTLGYVGDGKIGYSAIIVPTKGGNFTVVHEKERFFPLFGDENIDTIEEGGAIATYFLLEKLGPARLAGEVVLVHEMVNEKRRAWLYNPGQRRVRRAPTVAYDNPIVATESLMTNDQGRLFNGQLDRFNFKLLGKKEIYVLYNNFGMDITPLSYKEIFGPKYPRRDLMRYELHRVWVVEATVREGKRHLFSKRTFYLDEDSWVVVAEDIYDKRGQIWRVMEEAPKLIWEVPTCVADGSYSYDLVAGRYVADRQKTHEPPQIWDAKSKGLLDDASGFMPDALRRMGVR